MAKLTPYPFQVEDLAKLRANNYTGLIAIEAGGGKSLTATLTIAEARPRVTLIIAPKSTHNTAWIPTVRDNAGVTPRVIGNDNKVTKAALWDFLLGESGVFIASPQFVTRADVSEWRGDMIIHDEAHQGSTAKSKMQRKLGGYHPSDGHPLAHRFTHRLALTGTPMRQNFSNLWGVMRMLWGDSHYARGQVGASNFILWEADRMTHQMVYTNQRNPDGSPKTVKEYLGEAQPGRLLAEMPCAIVHKRRETCCRHHNGGFLPTEEPQVIRRTVELTAKQKKSVKDMEQTMMAWLDDNPLVADIPLTAKQRVRQLTLGEASVEYFMGVNSDGDEVEKNTIVFDPDCASPALDEAIHILSNLPDDENVVVYLESRRFAEVAVKRFNEAGFKAAEYSGVTKADLTRFGKDYRVLVGVISALGTGTAGLNHVAHTDIFIEQPISLTNLEQVSARLDRLDNTHRVQRFILLDDLGVQEGRFEDLAATKIAVNRSLRVVA